MKILIAGGTGFIGHHLIKALIQEGHQITIISRKHPAAQSIPTITWEQLNQLNPSDFHVVINLAGENIGEKRWTTDVKKKF